MEFYHVFSEQIYHALRLDVNDEFSRSADVIISRHRQGPTRSLFVLTPSKDLASSCDRQRVPPTSQIMFRDVGHMVPHLATSFFNDIQRLSKSTTISQLINSPACRDADNVTSNRHSRHSRQHRAIADLPKFVACSGWGHVEHMRS